MQCSLYRWKISQTLNNGSELNAATGRHVRHCDTCRAFYENALKLETGMSSPPEEDCPTLLHSKIMTSVRTARSTMPERASRVIPAWMPLLATLMLALTAGLFYMHAHQSSTADIVASVAIGEITAGKAKTTALLLNAPIAASEPIDRELRLLEKDIINARDFLNGMFCQIP